MNIKGDIEQFFETPLSEISQISCERALQLEMGLYFRARGYEVAFERKCTVQRIDTSFERPKSRLDLMLLRDGRRAAIELKFPENGRHPESMFDYCKDIEFVESILRAKEADEGFCIMATSDHNFWNDSGRRNSIQDSFRRDDVGIKGRIFKPTGSKKPYIHLSNQYFPSLHWKSITANILNNGRYLLLEIPA